LQSLLSRKYFQKGLQKKYIPDTLHDSLHLWQHQKDKNAKIETIIHRGINQVLNIPNRASPK